MKTKSVTKKVKKAKAPKKASGFQIQIEYLPNKDIVDIHTMKKFPKSNTDTRLLDTVLNKVYVKGNQHPLIRSIRRFDGVYNVSSERFELRIEKAKLFDWDDILPKVRRALKKHFADGKELNELPAIRPSAEYLAALRRQGCDV